MQVNNFHTKIMSFVLVDNDNRTKYCPPRNCDNKDLHPRVALKFFKGVAICPYCGVEFRLKK